MRGDLDTTETAVKLGEAHEATRKHFIAGIAWLNESTRWHCPRGVVLLPVVDMNVTLAFNLIWKKDNSSPLLQKFVAQVGAAKIQPN